MENFELNIDGQDISNTQLYMAIQDRDSHKVLNAIYQGEDVNLKDQEFQSTYLHLVVSIADPITEPKLVAIIYQLANAGTDVNATDYKGRTALDLAIHRQLLELMVALIRVGVDTKEKDYRAEIKQMVSPFELELMDVLEKYDPGMWHVVASNNISMAYMLINSWCRININKKGIKLLQYARGTKKAKELIDLLDDYEVTIEFVHATLAGDEKRMLEFLMDSKPCDPYIMDISYQERWSMPLRPRSLRDAAIAMGHTHVLHLLPEEEADTALPQSPGIIPQVGHLNASNLDALEEESESLSLNLHSGGVHRFTVDTESSGDQASSVSSRSSKHSGRSDGASSSTSKPVKPKGIKASTWSKARGKIWKSVSKRNSFDDSELPGSGLYNEDGSRLGHIATPRRSIPSQYVYDLHDYSHNWASEELQQKTKRKASLSKSMSKETKSKLCVISWWWKDCSLKMAVQSFGNCRI